MENLNSKLVWYSVFLLNWKFLKLQGINEVVEDLNVTSKKKKMFKLPVRNVPKKKGILFQLFTFGISTCNTKKIWVTTEF